MKIKKRKLICMVGDSGAGKTLLSKHLQEKMGVQNLVSHTTRPMREGETNGVEHWFVSKDDIPNRKEMLAFTVFGGHYYWAEMRSLFCNEKDNYSPIIYIIDEYGLKNLIDNYGCVFNIITIYIKRDSNLLQSSINSQRLERDKTRDKMPIDQFDYVIYNNSTIDEFLEQGEQIMNKIIND